MKNPRAGRSRTSRSVHVERARKLLFGGLLGGVVAAVLAMVGFGIGTNLTNDLGYEAINIVIKMTECNGQPVAKVSDAPGKTVSKDPGYLAYLRQVFGLDSEKV